MNKLFPKITMKSLDFNCSVRGVCKKFTASFFTVALLMILLVGCDAEIELFDNFVTDNELAGAVWQFELTHLDIFLIFDDDGTGAELQQSIRTFAWTTENGYLFLQGEFSGSYSYTIADSDNGRILTLTGLDSGNTNRFFCVATSYERCCCVRIARDYFFGALSEEDAQRVLASVEVNNSTMSQAEPICEQGDTTLDIEGTSEERAEGREAEFPDIVDKLPTGFIALNLVLETNSEILSSLFWSTNIVFQDVKGITIFQTNVRNNEFIVIYNNSYYVNEKIILEIMEKATISWERLNKIYSVGDTIEMDGILDGNAVVFGITISSVKRDDAGERNLYAITIQADHELTQLQALRFFHSVETRCGNIFDNFFTLPSIDDGVRSDSLPSHQQLVIIALDSEMDIYRILLHVPQGLRRSVFQTNTYSVRL